jgi:hypothetical protein
VTSVGDVADTVSTANEWLPRGSRQMPNEGTCQKFEFGLDFPLSPNLAAFRQIWQGSTKFGRALGSVLKREANGFDPMTSSKLAP